MAALYLAHVPCLGCTERRRRVHAKSGYRRFHHQHNLQSEQYPARSADSLHVCCMLVPWKHAHTHTRTHTHTNMSLSPRLCVYQSSGRLNATMHLAILAMHRCVCACVRLCVGVCGCVCLQGNRAPGIGGGANIQAVGSVQTPLHATRAHTIFNCTFINNTAGQVRYQLPIASTHTHSQVHAAKSRRKVRTRHALSKQVSACLCTHMAPVCACLIVSCVTCCWCL